MAGPGNKPNPIFDDDVQLEEKQKTKKPKLYKVLLHNDDYTTMDFVVYILMRFFHKDDTEATQIMLYVHTKGVGVCGVFTKDLAETKVEQVTEEARSHNMPLLCTMEPE